MIYIVDKLKMPGFRDFIVSGCGTLLDRARTGVKAFASPVSRRNVLGVHCQKQDAFLWVGACLPAGCSTAV